MALLVPSLSYSQTQRPSDKPDVHAVTTDPVEVRGDNPAAKPASERRSLMGMVMDVLIASAEQQSALEKTARQAALTHAAPAHATASRTAMTGAAATSVTSAKSASSSDLATREQIAVESEP
ncbi:MAG TPA: hypothetical protein VGE88_16040 [Lysobacter sp.]